MICVKDVSGDIVIDSASTAPNCAEYALLTASEITATTYWADLAVWLEPGGEPFNALVTVMIVAYGSIAAIRMVLSKLKRLSNET